MYTSLITHLDVESRTLLVLFHFFLRNTSPSSFFAQPYLSGRSRFEPEPVLQSREEAAAKVWLRSLYPTFEVAMTYK